MPQYTMEDVEREENEIHWAGVAYQSDMVTPEDKKRLLEHIAYNYEMRFFPATGQGAFTDEQRGQSQEAADKFTAMVRIYIPDWQPTAIDSGNDE